MEGTALDFENRAIVLVICCAMGRGSEVAMANFGSLRWGEDGHSFWAGWGETKTGHDIDLSFHPHKDNCILCLHNALCCCLITGGAKLSQKRPDEPLWLFPELAKIVEGGAAAKAPRILKELLKRGVAEGLTNKHASHSFRSGAADDLALQAGIVDAISIVCRGNW